LRSLRYLLFMSGRTFRPFGGDAVVVAGP